MTAGGTVGGRQPVLIRMPAPEKAPGFLDGLRSMALMRVNELDADWLAIEPAEGAGRVRDYFALSRLADSSTAVSDASWDRLRENPPWHSGIDELPHGPVREGEPWRQSILRWSETIFAADRPEAGLAWLSAQITGSEPAQVPALLTKYAPPLLEGQPQGSFWFFRTDGLLGRRFAINRVLLALAEVPDVVDHSDPDAQTVPPLLSLEAP